MIKDGPVCFIIHLAPLLGNLKNYLAVVTFGSEQMELVWGEAMRLMSARDTVGPGN